MTKTKIKLVVLGYLKYPIDWQRIAQWRSDLFALSKPISLELLPNAEGDDWDYSDRQLSTILHADGGFDITVGIINATLQDNYYLRRLSSNTCVLSLNETADILKLNSLEIENFIIRNLYEIVATYEAFRHQIPESAYSIAHDETRCCLFDMCADKNDIIHSNQFVRLCEHCRTTLKEKGVSAEIVKTIDGEISRIKKRLFYRLRDWVIVHPILSICLSMLLAIVLNLAASFLYDWVKPNQPVRSQSSKSADSLSIGK